MAYNNVYTPLYHTEDINLDHRLKATDLPHWEDMRNEEVPKNTGQPMIDDGGIARPGEPPMEERRKSEGQNIQPQTLSAYGSYYTPLPSEPLCVVHENFARQVHHLSDPPKAA
ncbi:uncharacterized protein MCYG_05525 [Microsporum canis CBS 113480]|uniref:Uncharacterized protein n=1 Tax=Arthroderma otae (strain ATCC MYA-4605 / CBS 113480) TaxID=554155 RepID=C5FS53_ARTOC|nr:uncharacterized protein MCYG_05525 [Microsporum canis CBS 113480]EEQ32706.1 predicted protein [Microsporum canis CBS 113480]